MKTRIPPGRSKVAVISEQQRGGDHIPLGSLWGLGANLGDTQGHLGDPLGLGATRGEGGCVISEESRL